jgi:hypothetical protein
MWREDIAYNRQRLSCLRRPPRTDKRSEPLKLDYPCYLEGKTHPNTSESQRLQQLLELVAIDIWKDQGIL